MNDSPPYDVDTGPEDDAFGCNASDASQSSASIALALIIQLQEYQKEISELRKKQELDKSQDKLSAYLKEWEKLGDKIAGVELPTISDGGQTQEKVKDDRKVFSNAKADDLLKINVAKDHRKMDTEKLLSEITRRNTSISDSESFQRCSKQIESALPILQLFVSPKKEAASRIFIDLFVIAVIQMIFWMNEGMAFLLPEMTLASAGGGTPALESPGGMGVTLWSGVADYGIAFAAFLQGTLAQTAELALEKIAKQTDEEYSGGEEPSAEEHSKENRKVQLRWTLVEAKRLKESSGEPGSKLLAALPQAITQSLACTKRQGYGSDGDDDPTPFVLSDGKNWVFCILVKEDDNSGLQRCYHSEVLSLPEYTILKSKNTPSSEPINKVLRLLLGWVKMAPTEIVQIAKQVAIPLKE